MPIWCRESNMVPLACGLRVSLILEILDRWAHLRRRSVTDYRFSQHDSLGGKRSACRLLYGQLVSGVKDADGAKVSVWKRVPDRVEDHAPIWRIHLNGSTRYDCDCTLHIVCIVSQPYWTVTSRMSTLAQATTCSPMFGSLSVEDGIVLAIPFLLSVSTVLCRYSFPR